MYVHNSDPTLGFPICRGSRQATIISILLIIIHSKSKTSVERGESARPEGVRQGRVRVSSVFNIFQRACGSGQFLCCYKRPNKEHQQNTGECLVRNAPCR